MCHLLAASARTTRPLMIHHNVSRFQFFVVRGATLDMVLPSRAVVSVLGETIDAVGDFAAFEVPIEHRSVDNGELAAEAAK